MKYEFLGIAVVLSLLGPMPASADSIIVGGTFVGDFNLVTTDDVVDAFEPLVVAGNTSITANSIVLDNLLNEFIGDVYFQTTGFMIVNASSGLHGSFFAGGFVGLAPGFGDGLLHIDALVADDAGLRADLVSFTNAQEIMMTGILMVTANTILFQFTDGSAPELSSLNVGGLDLRSANVIISSIGPPISVPEPPAIALFGLGLVGILLARLRKKV